MNTSEGSGNKSSSAAPMDMSEYLNVQVKEEIFDMDADKENQVPRKRSAAALDNGANGPTEAKKVPSPSSGNGKEYACPKCPKTYKTLGAMKNHAASHMATKAAPSKSATAEKNNFSCSVCGDGFSEVRLLNEHLVKAHTTAGGSPSHQCKDCKKAFDSKNVLLNHKCVDKPTIPTPVAAVKKNVCSVCNDEFSEVRLLNEHIVRAHTAAGSSLNHRCKDCKKTFDSKKVLINHKCLAKPIIHTAEATVKKNSCPVCKDEFSEVRQLNEHIIMAHTTAGGSLSHQCKDCDKTFDSKKVLLNHKCTAKPMIHTAEAAVKKNVCPVCKDEFSEVRQLNEHMVKAHTNAGSSPTHQCKDCKKTFNTKKVLLNHKCTAQPKTPAAEVAVKKNVCPVCKDEFPEVRLLNEHIITAHTAAGSSNSNQCKDCKKSFNSKKVLLDHKCVDKPNTLIQCPQCELKFKEQAHVDRHVHDYHDTDEGAIRDSMAADIMEDGEDSNEEEDEIILEDVEDCNE